MKKAFTLAEVLITLTIIGVIAVLTIPNLMQKWQDQQAVSGVKEAYAIFDNAFKMAIREKGAPVTDWDWPTTRTYQHGVNGNFLAETLMPYLKVKTYCGSEKGETQPCYSYATSHQAYGWKYYKNLNGTQGPTINDSTNFGGKMMLNNGMTAAFNVQEPVGCTARWGRTMGRYCKNYIGFVLVDINGKKGPNQLGFDVFYLPYGGDGIMIDKELISDLNNDNWSSSAKSKCYNRNSTGQSCACWIILHNNTDYKYRDISTEW